MHHAIVYAVAVGCGCSMREGLWRTGGDKVHRRDGRAVDHCDRHCQQDLAVARCEVTLLGDIELIELVLSDCRATFDAADEPA